MELVLRLLLIIFFIALNAFFVASELALVASRRTKIQTLAKKGNKRARAVQKALGQLDRYISATQLGITIASLALGWIGEPTVAKLVEPMFSFLPTHIALISSHTIAILVGFSLITFVHIVLGELTPKRIALSTAEKTSLLLITPLNIFVFVFSPIIHLLNLTGNFITKAIGFSKMTSESVHSEEEIKLILSDSAARGVIEKEEAEMVYSVFRFGDTPVKEIMIPSKEVLAFKSSMQLADVAKKVTDHPHSRFPVYEKSIKDITGFIHVKDLYQALLKHGENITLDDCSFVRKIIYTSEKTRIDDVLREMQRKRVHISAIKNKSNKIIGIVTLEDVIESIVGEIEDEFER
jgi:CBS domain containing-hemolysin-like protein